MIMGGFLDIKGCELERVVEGRSEFSETDLKHQCKEKYLRQNNVTFCVPVEL
jgi:hypothetical protein